MVRRWRGFSLFLLMTGCGSSAFCDYDPGLLWEDGIEPGTASTCEAGGGNSCWWIDCDSGTDGVGTYADPANHFSDIIGYLDGASSYQAGSVGSGDYVYVKGTCSTTKHTDYTKEMRIDIRREAQCGTPGDPTVIKSYKGTTRAVFDLESTTQEPAIRVSGFTGPCDGIVIQNIEIDNHAGQGIALEDDVKNFQIISNYIHDGIADGTGTYGSISAFINGAHTYTGVIRNNHLLNNDGAPVGGLFNRGGISILYGTSANSASTVDIYANVIDQEVIAIRDKHDGPGTIDVYENLIKNCEYAFYLRAYDSLIHHNVIHDISAVTFMYSPENQTAAHDHQIYNNTVVDSPVFIDDTADDPAFDLILNVYDNLYKDSDATRLIVLGEFGGVSYDINDFSSSYNMWDFNDSAAEFSEIDGTDRNLADTKTAVGDTTSTDVTFTTFFDEGNNDFRLAPGSPAATGGTGGGIVGALGTVSSCSGG